MPTEHEGSRPLTELEVHRQNHEAFDFLLSSIPRGRKSHIIVDKQNGVETSLVRTFYTAPGSDKSSEPAIELAVMDDGIQKRYLVAKSKGLVGILVTGIAETAGISWEFEALSDVSSEKITIESSPLRTPAKLLADFVKREIQYSKIKPDLTTI